MSNQNREGQEMQYRNPTLVETLTLNHFTEAASALQHLLRQPTMLPLATNVAGPDEAISKRASLFELYRLNIILGQWFSINSTFLGWIKTHLLLNDRIIQVLETRVTKQIRAMLCIRALVIAKFLKRPAVNHNNFTLTNSDGTVSPLNSRIKLFLEEMTSSEFNGRTYFGPPNTLKSIFEDSSPETVLHLLRDHQNVIFTTLTVDEHNKIQATSNKCDASTNTPSVIVEHLALPKQTDAGILIVTTSSRAKKRNLEKDQKDKLKKEHFLRSVNKPKLKKFKMLQERYPRQSTSKP